MRVLFVCEGNVNRSQMAATMLKSLMPEIEVTSAGTMVRSDREGRPVAEETTLGIELMKAIGLDMSGAVQHRLTPQMVEDADRVVLVGPTPGGPLPVFLAESPKLEVWDVPDPGYGHISVEEARDMIRERLVVLAKAIKDE